MFWFCTQQTPTITEPSHKAPHFLWYVPIKKQSTFCIGKLMWFRPDTLDFRPKRRSNTSYDKLWLRPVVSWSKFNKMMGRTNTVLSLCFLSGVTSYDTLYLNNAPWTKTDKLFHQATQESPIPLRSKVILQCFGLINQRKILKQTLTGWEMWACGGHRNICAAWRSFDCCSRFSKKGKSDTFRDKYKRCNVSNKEQPSIWVNSIGIKIITKDKIFKNPLWGAGRL